MTSDQPQGGSALYLAGVCLVVFYQLSIVLGILLAYQPNLMLVNYAGEHPNAFGDHGPLHRALIEEVW